MRNRRTTLLSAALGITALMALSGCPTEPPPTETTTTTVDPGGPPNINLVTNVLPMPSGPYAQQLAATGTTGDVTWALDAGILPPGVTLASDGLLSGTVVYGPGFDISLGMRVRITDDTGSVTRLITFTGSAIPPVADPIEPPPLVAPLPEGLQLWMFAQASPNPITTVAGPGTAHQAILSTADSLAQASLSAPNGVDSGASNLLATRSNFLGSAVLPNDQQTIYVTDIFTGEVVGQYGAPEFDPGVGLLASSLGGYTVVGYADRYDVRDSDDWDLRFSIPKTDNSDDLVSIGNRTTLYLRTNGVVQTLSPTDGSVLTTLDTNAGTYCTTEWFYGEAVIGECSEGTFIAPADGSAPTLLPREKAAGVAPTNGSTCTTDESATYRIGAFGAPIASPSGRYVATIETCDDPVTSSSRSTIVTMKAGASPLISALSEPYTAPMDLTLLRWL